MEGHHLHSHAHRHLHGSGHRLNPRAPTPIAEPPVDMAVRAEPVARKSLNSGFVSRIFARTDCSTDSTSSACEKPVSSSSLTLPIVLAVVIPIVIGLCVMVYFHRKTAQRHKREDEDAKYKSMDFGMDDVRPKNGKRRSKLFGGGEKDVSHTKGLSMDINLSSPYLLPPELQQSRESLHSLAKTLNQDGDPYRHVEKFIASDVGSMRSFPRATDRGSSIYTSSSGRDSSRPRPPPPAGLQTNFQPRQKSLPTSPLPQLPPAARQNSVDTSSPLSARQNSTSTLPPYSATSAKSAFRFTDDEKTVPQVGGVFVEEPLSMPAMPEIPERAVIARKDVSHDAHRQSITPDQSYVGGLVGDRDSSALPASDLQHTDPHGLGIMGMNSSAAHNADVPEVSQPHHSNNAHVVSGVPSEYEDYANHFQFTQHDEAEDFHGARGRQMDRQADAMDQEQNAGGLGVPQQANKRLSVGFRPLPPDELLESEDPEFRANRIRSFYKEYFEDGKEPRPPMPQPQAAQYYEDYDAGYLGDTAYFDPDSNAFVMPYAQPVTRRAMTPPPNNRRAMPSRPRGPPGPHGMGPPGPRPRAGSTMSGGRYGPMSPRPNSSASGRMGGRAPKKPLPPPSSLSTLPTPSKLRDDSFALMGAIDFAPPPTFRDQAAGRSQSPLGERRPYQLSIPVSSPLVSAFDDMASLPSPYSLRKSGTFTGLDFAPPRKFKDPDSMSEAGSVRSMGSGISARNLGAIRNGAGRVSRLPGDQVFTSAAMNDTLKPKWGMRD